MKIDGTEVYGFRKAIARAMRNPKNSWDRSDSKFYAESMFTPGSPWQDDTSDPEGEICAWIQSLPYMNHFLEADTR